MSYVIQVASLVSNNPQLVSISSTGLQDITGPFSAPTNGFILNDLSMMIVNCNAMAAGNVVCAGAVGLVQVAGGPFFIPIQTFNFRQSATAAGVITINIPITRSFGDGLIGQQFYNRLYVDCTTFTNLSTFNFTLDLTGFLY